MSIIVMKFGGTSVADAEAIRNTARIVRQASAGGVRPVVVVSAMSGVTDGLLGAARLAAAGDAVAADAAISDLRTRHERVVDDLGVPGARMLHDAIRHRFEGVGKALAAVAASRTLPGATIDVVVAAGELLNSRIVAAALSAAGAASAFVDATEVLVTDANHTKAAPDSAGTERAAANAILPLVRTGSVPVLGGFVGRSHDGAITTLGRGGSDYSASLIGEAIHADEIQIWTDVDGMLTADPRIVDAPLVIDHLSFHEASELAYFGAKVLHPSTILPAVARDIPVRILNSRRPARRGTLITGRPVLHDRPVTAVACKRNITVIDVTSTRMLMAYGFLRRVFETFEQLRTAVDVVTTSEVSVSMTVDDPRSLPDIVTALSAFSHVEVESDMAIVCAVGENLRRRPEMVAGVVGALSAFPLRMVSQAASRRNLTVVVPDRVVPSAMRHLHDEFVRAVAVS